MNLYKKQTGTSEVMKIVNLLPEEGNIADLIDYLIDIQNRYSEDEVFYCFIETKRVYGDR
jgi:hypothetical protein